MGESHRCVLGVSQKFFEAQKSWLEKRAEGIGSTISGHGRPAGFRMESVDSFPYVR